MRMVDLIEKKRNGHVLSENEIKFFINGYISGDIPEYQVSAMLMAIYFRGMNKEEIAYLTKYMLNSGDRLDLSSLGNVVDKHSTGGVGDKTTMIVGPIVASCGVNVAKMSGRGLGHTGGTIDKLESIPGFNVNLTKDEFINEIKSIGMSVVSQTEDLVIADKNIPKIINLLTPTISPNLPFTKCPNAYVQNCIEVSTPS